MPEHFLPLVAKQGQAKTVQGQTNKYVEVRGNTHFITYVISIPTYIHINIYIRVYYFSFVLGNNFFFLHWRPKHVVYPVSFSYGWECCCQQFKPSFSLLTPVDGCQMFLCCCPPSPLCCISRTSVLVEKSLDSLVLNVEFLLYSKVISMSYVNNKFSLGFFCWIVCLVVFFKEIGLKEKLWLF